MAAVAAVAWWIGFRCMGWMISDDSGSNPALCFTLFFPFFFFRNFLSISAGSIALEKVVRLPDQ